MIELAHDDPLEVLVTRRRPGISGRQTREQQVWMLSVEVGDVLQNARGSQRVVRAVKRYPEGDLRTVTFAIRNRSWTARPFTCLSYTDLMTQGFRPTGVRLKLDSPEDLALEFVIRSSPDVLPHLISPREAMDMP